MHLIVIALFVLLTEGENVWGLPASLCTVDLSHDLDNHTVTFPGLPCFKSSNLYLKYFGTTVFKSEEFSASTHTGTHLDAPCGVIPGGHTVPEIPLKRLVAPAAVIDIREKVTCNRNYEVQIDDLLQWEHTTGVCLNDVILLVRSGWSKYWSNRTAYVGNPNNDLNDLHFPGVAPSTSRWLVTNRNVYGVGIDTISLSAGQSDNFLTYLILNSKNIYGLANLNNLDELPLFGATLHVMPIKIRGACGGLARIVATFPSKTCGGRNKYSSL